MTHGLLTAKLKMPVFILSLMNNNNNNFYYYCYYYHYCYHYCYFYYGNEYSVSLRSWFKPR